MGGAYIGQDPRLLWAKPGLDKFRQQLKKKVRAHGLFSLGVCLKVKIQRERASELGLRKEPRCPKERNSAGLVRPGSILRSNQLRAGRARGPAAAGSELGDLVGPPPVDDQP